MKKDSKIKEISIIPALLSAIVILVFGFGITVVIGSKKLYLYDLIKIFSQRTAIYVQEFWGKNDISNLNLYLFTGQIAFAVLLGTAISFISHLLETKHYGFKTKEVLLYKFRSKQFTIVDIIFLNFILIFVSLCLITLKYSEVALVAIFSISLILVVKVLKTIFEVFFSNNYLQYHTKSIIDNELNKMKKYTQNRDNNDIYSHNFIKVELIIERIKEHTYELANDLTNIKYRENIYLVCDLGMNSNIASINDIVTSISYGSFIEDIGIYLRKINRFDEILFQIYNPKIRKNCNPKLLAIDKVPVAEMYSSHYYKALRILVESYIKNALELPELKLLDKASESCISATKFMCDNSINFTNHIYSDMEERNWKQIIMKLLTNLMNYDKINETNYTIYAINLMCSDDEHIDRVWLKDCVILFSTKIKDERVKEIIELVTTTAH